MRFPTMWYVRPAKAQSDQSICLSLEYSLTAKLLTEHHLEFLSLKEGCTGSFESTDSTHVKMTHCWKSHVTAHIQFTINSNPDNSRNLLKPYSTTIYFLHLLNIFKCTSEIFCMEANNMTITTCKGSDQPVHKHSLIRAFASR